MANWIVVALALCAMGCSKFRDEGVAPAYRPGDADFSTPNATYIDEANDLIYVSDSGGHRVQKWKLSTATYIGFIGGGQDLWQTGLAPEVCGHGDRDFNGPTEMVKSGDNLLIVDSGNGRIQSWNAESGVYNGWYGNGVTGLQWGWADLKFDYGYLYTPDGWAFNASGEIFVADVISRRVSRFNTDFSPNKWIGYGNTGWQTGAATQSLGDQSLGHGDAEFSCPDKVTLDTDGNIYVSDLCANVVMKWSSAGTYIGYIGRGEEGWKTGQITPNAGSTANSGALTLDQPKGIKVGLDGPDEVLYIVENLNMRVSKWTLDGHFIGMLGEGLPGWVTEFPWGINPATGDYYKVYGPGDRYLTDPSHISIVANGDFYITDMSNHRIVKYLSDGTYVGWFGHKKDGWQTGDAPRKTR